MEGADSKSVAAFKASNPRARLDRYGFAFFAAQVIEPQHALLQQTGPAISVDVIGKSNDTRGLDNPVSLPARIALSCDQRSWRVNWQGSGGGDNVRSETRISIELRLSADGQLLAQGTETVVKGWLIKHQITLHWRARFGRR